MLGAVMWSYCTLNDYWQVVSWIMVQGDNEHSLENYYVFLKSRYLDSGDVPLADIRWVDRDCCQKTAWFNKEVQLSKTHNDWDE